jgi:hypothetical protein
MEPEPELGPELSTSWAELLYDPADAVERTKKRTRTEDSRSSLISRMAQEPKKQVTGCGDKMSTAAVLSSRTRLPAICKDVKITGATQVRGGSGAIEAPPPW